MTLSVKVRVMRVLSSTGMVKETGKEQYEALPVTKVLATPAMQAAQKH